MMKFGRIATRWSPLSGQGGTTSGVGASEMDDRALPPTLSNPPLLPIIAGVLAVGIFVVDTASTLDMAIAVLYCVVVLMGASFLHRRGVLLLSSTFGIDCPELPALAPGQRGHGSGQVPREPLGDRRHDLPRPQESVG